MTGCLRGAGQVRPERHWRLLLVRHGAEAVPGKDPGLGQEGVGGGEEGKLLLESRPLSLHNDISV